MLESVNEGLKFMCDRIRREVLLHSVALFRELISFSLDVFSIDIAEFLFNPSISTLLPLIERTPHQASELKLLSKVL